MKSNTKLTLAAAAISGLLGGSATRAFASTPTSSGRSTVSNVVVGHRAITLDDSAKHSCKGQNACKGQGGCKTGDNGCKGKNSCKGKGGCKTDESADKLASTMGQKAVMALDDSKHSCKGQNACKGQGGCKTGDNGCKGKNSCKGKGGCKTDESADKLFVAPFAR